MVGSASSGSPTEERRTDERRGVGRPPLRAQLGNEWNSSTISESV